MQYRQLGRLDVKLSIIGFGGIVITRRPQEDADREVAQAVERGVTYFDVAPTYGNAQDLLGPALRPFRQNVVLACKTTQRQAEGARKELEQSLSKLQTDHFDIYQLHGLAKLEETRTALGPGGALETLLDAKSKGLVRFIGFSAHDEDSALLAIESGRFDTVLYPLNYVTYEHGAFGPKVLQAANQRGLGIMALKAMARTRIPRGQPKPYDKCWYAPEDDPQLVKLLLRYTLSLPGVAAAIPPGDPGLFHMALNLADELTPLDQDGRNHLEEHLAQVEPLFSTHT